MYVKFGLVSRCFNTNNKVLKLKYTPKIITINNDEMLYLQ